jgi:drug/metabolite transporter (DMT)-like permease
MISAPNRRGIALMTAAMACYVLNDTLVKLTLDVFPPGQVLAVRGVAATAALALVSHRRLATPGAMRTLWRPLLALRCALEVTTAGTSVLALSQASLSSVSAIMMTAPLLIAMTSMTLGWEPARPGRLLAVAFGLAGALLILRPAAQPLSDGVILACLCAVSLAARDLATRRLPPSLPSAMVAATASCAACAAGPVLGWAMDESWASVARRETWVLVGAALCTAAGNYSLIAACRGSDLAVVTPFRYSLLVWACLATFWVWGDVPDAAGTCGIVVIVVAGIFTMRGAVRR